MIGNDARRIVVQERDRYLLRELSRLRICDRDQAKCIAGFGSTTRANARLLALHRSGLLRRFFIGTEAGGKKALYALSEKGAHLVNVPYRGLRRRQDQMLVADFSVMHQLAVNSVYCAWKGRVSPAMHVTTSRWLTFHEPITKALQPDGYVEFDLPSETIAVFLELDLGHESLTVLQEKARNYLQLAGSGNYERLFHRKHFRVLLLAHSEQRARSIAKAVSKVTEKLFWFGSLTNALEDRLHAPVWLRPREKQPEPFFGATP
jgi:hypothetical protein